MTWSFENEGNEVSKSEMDFEFELEFRKGNEYLRWNWI